MASIRSSMIGFQEASYSLARSSLILILCLLPGCCPRPAVKPDPFVSLNEYLESSRQGKIEDARKLLSDRARKDASPEVFTEYFKAGGQTLVKRFESLAGAKNLEMVLRATLSDGLGNHIEMVQEDGCWRIDGGPIVPNAESSPEGALGRFLRAADAGDCQTLLSCAPPRIFERHTRAQILSGCRNQQAQLKETAAAIRKSAKKPRRISDTRAEMEFGQDQKLILVKVAERWYIEDL